MGSASDDVQILSEDARSKSTSGSGLPLTAGRQSHAHVQNKDHAISGDDSAVKVRKQYTITKQRERWTDEEHNKFLDALKLYGRAWRHIEEHVGTKTAVQIRSHAQKFFSKVVRVSSINAEENSVKPIEIPPPRPKRKPIHPYPRKMIGLDKTRAHLSNELDLTASPSPPILPQETLCLASVLSTLGSEATGVSNSNMSNSILSQTSSEAQAHDQPSALLRSETILLPAEKGSENGSNSPIPEDGPFVKEGSNEEISTQTLKLFGKTITIGEQSLPSSRNMPNISPGIRFLPTNTDYMWTAVSHGTPTVYCTQVPDENSKNVDHVSTTPIPCWQRQLYGRVPYPYQYNYLNGNTFQDKVLQKHGSMNGSNSGSINAEMDGV